MHVRVCMFCVCMHSFRRVLCLCVGVGVCTCVHLYTCMYEINVCVCVYPPHWYTEMRRGCSTVRSGSSFSLTWQKENTWLLNVDNISELQSSIVYCLNLHGLHKFFSTCT